MVISRNPSQVHWVPHSFLNEPLILSKLLKTSVFLSLFLTYCLSRELVDTGLGPEVVDLNANDVSFENEKKLPYLKKPYINTSPRDRRDQLQVGKLGSEVKDRASILSYANSLAEPSGSTKFGNTDSLLIAHQGKLILEAYYRRGRLNYPHYQMSITKSYTAYAIGRAIQLGHLTMEDLNKPAVSFLSQIDSSQLAEGAGKITLDQAMRMCSGISLPQKRLPDILSRPELLTGQGQAQAYLHFTRPLPPVPKPFKYQASDPVLTMQILEAVVPGSAEQFIREHLLKPLGISNYNWQEDLSGYPKSAAGSSIRSRDMIKVGLLTLNHGKWEGKQFLPRAFVKKATSPLVQTNEENFYGYFWWHQTREIHDKKYPVIQGRGAGGQFIFVFPTLDLVVAATAHNQGMGKMLKELPEELIPAFAK